MAREHPDYRDVLEGVQEFLGEKRVLTQADICRYTGKSPKWVRKHIGLGNHNILAAEKFARMLSKGV